MTSKEKLTLVRVMAGSPDPDDPAWTDDVLKAYLGIARQKILDRLYPFGSGRDLPPRYNHLQCEIAVYLLNKRGAEGQTSHSENGISRAYESADVPESMLRSVTPSCGVPM